MGSLDWLPSLALEYILWGALELVISRISLNACAVVVPDCRSGVPARTLRGSDFEPLISRAIAGWQLVAPVFFKSAGFVGSWSGRPTSC
jgi:hypothetical protein